MKHSYLSLLPLLVACSFSLQAEDKGDISPPIAFMPDIHFHDVYGKFNDAAFKGLKNSHSQDYATIRTMYAQLTSTRLFNENYFALRAALDDAAQRNIKLIALPGDFSDDGQPIHIRGLVEILKEYSQKYDMRFYATPGNHDPNRPFDRPSGEEDFLGVDGKVQRIYSRGAQECKDYDGSTAVINAGHELPTICSEEVLEMGHEKLLDFMSIFGMKPSKQDLYWETPYTRYKQGEYTYEKALAGSEYQQRTYEICQQGTGGAYKQAGYGPCFDVADMSYLVEPIPGLWMLAIDANAYVPNKNADMTKPTNASNFAGSGDAGYNKMLTHKQQTMAWIGDVVKRAEAQNKTLIAFSHFPMVEFDNGASGEIEKIFGKGKFQLVRAPTEDTSRALAEIGIKLHVGGHMHFNDTGVRRYDNNVFLFNVQAPSMAAYVPAYKIVTFKADNKVAVDTVILKDVPRFNELFEHYQQEWDHLKSTQSPALWNKDILNAKDYYEFTNWHISELTRLRFIPSEWPCDIRQMLFSMSGKDMLILSQLDSKTRIADVLQINPSKGMNDTCPTELKIDAIDMQKIYQVKNAKAWEKVSVKATELAKSQKMTLNNFAQWNGFDLAVDFYRLRNADELALKDISLQRLSQYNILTGALAKNLPDTPQQINPDSAFEDIFRVRFGSIFTVLDRFIHGNPSNKFLLNMKNGEITNLSEQKRIQ